MSITENISSPKLIYPVYHSSISIPKELSRLRNKKAGHSQTRPIKSKLSCKHTLDSNTPLDRPRGEGPQSKHVFTVKRDFSIYSVFLKSESNSNVKLVTGVMCNPESPEINTIVHRLVGLLFTRRTHSVSTNDSLNTKDPRCRFNL